MTVKEPKSGVIELFRSASPERTAADAADDAASPGSFDNGSFAAIALIQKKLRAQISLVARARGANQPLPELHAALAELQQLTGSIINDLDRVIPTLADPDCSIDPDATRMDLYSRLTHLCSGFRASSGMECVLTVLPKHVQVDELAGDILFRAVCELLTNVRRHSHANRVEVSSAVGADGSVTLTVQDDGIGLPTGGHPHSALETGAIGLSSIDLRLREIGAHMQIESESGVCARLVLPAHVVGRPTRS